MTRLLTILLCLFAFAGVTQTNHITHLWQVQAIGAAKREGPHAYSMMMQSLGLVPPPRTNPPVLLAAWTASIDPLATSNRIYAVSGGKTNVTATSNTNEAALVITNRTSLTVTAVDTVSKRESLPSNTVHYPGTAVLQFSSKTGTNVEFTSAFAAKPRWGVTNSTVTISNPPLAGLGQFYRAIGGMNPPKRWIDYNGP